MQHLFWRHLSILAIPQLLLAQFLSNFKGRFLGPFRAYQLAWPQPQLASPASTWPYFQLAWPQPQLASPASTQPQLPAWAKATPVFVLGVCVCVT